MKLPFVTRKQYDSLLAENKSLLEKYENDRGIVAYIPQDNQNPTPGALLAHHDKRIGWVKPMKFKTYDDYLEFNRNQLPTTDTNERKGE